MEMSDEEFLQLLENSGHGNKLKALELYEEAKKLFLIKDYINALEKANYGISIADDKSLYNFYDLRALVYYHLNDYKASIEDYNKVLELDPDAKFVYFFRGSSYFMLDKYPEALSDLKKSLEYTERKEHIEPAKELIKKIEDMKNGK